MILSISLRIFSIINISFVEVYMALDLKLSDSFYWALSQIRRAFCLTALSGWVILKEMQISSENEASKKQKTTFGLFSFGPNPSFDEPYSQLLLFHITLCYLMFLVAVTQLYKRLCLSIGPSVRWSIGLSVRQSIGQWSIGLFVGPFICL